MRQDFLLAGLGLDRGTNGDAREVAGRRPILGQIPLQRLCPGDHLLGRRTQRAEQDLSLAEHARAPRQCDDLREPLGIDLPTVTGRAGQQELPDGWLDGIDVRRHSLGVDRHATSLPAIVREQRDP